MTGGTLTVWRHPRPIGAAGRCIGRTDVAVDRRKAKRLAHRIRAFARRAGLPRHVVTSPLRRAAAVGRILAGWGFRHELDPRLAELDFGAWDGRRWNEIGAAEVGAWTDDFARHAPGGGEPVEALLGRCAAVLAQPGAALAVGHAGWISGARWLEAAGDVRPTAAGWPAAIRYGRACRFAR